MSYQDGILVTSIYQISLIVATDHHITKYGQEPKKCTKTNSLKMYQDQFWANFRRGDAEKGSAPAADVRPLLAGWGSVLHRPPEYKASC
jgi:hypothetical protein